MIARTPSLACGRIVEMRFGRQELTTAGRASPLDPEDDPPDSDDDLLPQPTYEWLPISDFGSYGKGLRRGIVKVMKRIFGDLWNRADGVYFCLLRDDEGQLVGMEILVIDRGATRSGASGTDEDDDEGGDDDEGDDDEGDDDDRGRSGTWERYRIDSDGRVRRVGGGTFESTG